MTFEPGAALPPGTAQGAIYSSAGFDVIGLLSARSAELLRQLRLKASDLHAVMPEFPDRYEANTARSDAERRLQRLLAPRSEGGFNLREDDPQIIEQRRQVARLTDEARRLEERYEERSQQWQSAARVVQAVEQFLKDGGIPPGVMLEDHEVEVPKLNKGETIVDAIERLRRRGRELKADLHRIRSAPYPSSYAKQQMRAQIEQLAQQGAPNVANLIERDRQIEFVTQTLKSEVRSGDHLALGFATVEAAVPVLAWLLKDALIKRLDAEIDTESDDAAALTHEARQKAEAEVMGDLLAVEYDEARLVWQAQADKLPCEHRADCAAQAILQVRLVTAPRANPSPGTSPMHAYNIAGR